MAKWPARANCMASAVPQEPAPSTAMRSALMSLPGARRGALVLTVAAGRALANGLGVEAVEVDGLKQQLREAAAADHVRDRFAGERVDCVRAERADQHRLFVRVVAVDVEDARLRDLDQKDRRILLLGLDG